MSGALEQRRQAALAALLEKDIWEEAAGGRAVLHLETPGGRREDAERRLRSTAGWFVPPYQLNGRDPRGECDFAALKLVRSLYGKPDGISVETRKEIRRFFLEHDFESKYKSENHMLLFHTARFLFAQLEPETELQAYGKNGAVLLEEDGAFLTEYLQFRARRGWAEFDSVGYMAEDFAALLTLYDFAQEAPVRALAEMTLNLLLLDMAADCLGPLYCGAHGRIYAPAALDHSKSGMFALYWFYFGSEYEEKAKGSVIVEAILSGFSPAAFVYDALAAKPAAYENLESKHLHCISTEVPHRQVPQVEGSIDKYTYLCPDYALGAVNHQDPYPEDSDAKWYAHHQQHEWDLTLPGATDIKIFTHHPGSFGTEGQEHGYWTGDLGCCCGQVYCQKNILLATYDIPKREMQWIHAHVPFRYFEAVREEQFLFLCRNAVYISLWFSEGYQAAADGDFIDREIRSFGARHGVVCRVGQAEEYGSFDAFQKEMREEEVLFDRETMSLSCRGLSICGTSRSGGGRLAKFPYPVFDSPMMTSSYDSGKVRVKTADNDVILDFNEIKAGSNPAEGGL